MKYGKRVEPKRLYILKLGKYLSMTIGCAINLNFCMLIIHRIINLNLVVPPTQGNVDTTPQLM